MDAHVRRLLTDLELEAGGLELEARASDAAELADAGFAELGLIDRLSAAVGVELTVVLACGVDGLVLTGMVTAVGRDWLLVQSHGAEWVLPVDAVESVRGLPEHGVPAEARGFRARLGWASIVRRLAEDATACVVHLRSGRRHEAPVTRIGPEFLELGPLTVRAGEVAAVQVRD